MHKIGNVYRYKGFPPPHGELWLLVQHNTGSVVLVSIKSGMYWGISSNVEDFRNISEAEFNTICDSHGGRFMQIELLFNKVEPVIMDSREVEQIMLEIKEIIDDDLPF